MKVIEHAWKWARDLTRRLLAPRYVIWHHAAALNATPEQVHSWHLSRGWKGIAYHYYIRKSGEIHRGRPEWAVGGHTTGHNRELGVCCEGDFTRERMPAEQLAACRALRADIHSRYKVTDKRHRDLSPTACPGTHFPWADLLSGTTQPPATKHPLLKRGSAGDAVRRVQTLLRHHGHPVAIDGIFGPKTESAVRAFQASKRITVDGIVGPQTWASLESPAKRPEQPTVRSGSRGTAVRTLQEALRSKGYRIAIDGIFGPRTLSAVRAYQKKAGLAVDGIVGPKTWRALGY